MFSPWVDEEAKASLEMAKKNDRKMDLPPEVRAEIDRAAASIIMKNRLEIDSDSFYVLIRLTRRELGMMIFKDLEDATAGFEEWLREGTSIDDLDLVKVGLTGGKLESSPADWKKITERLVKGRQKHK